MNYDKLEFVETVEELAAMHNLEVPYEAGNGPSQIERHQRQSLYQLMDGLNAFYQQSLLQPAADPARQYLAKRGLSSEVIARFAIGYAPPGWDNVLKRFGGNQENRQSLIDAGMLVTNDKGRSYDRFRERVMFPIRDKRGRVIGFGGRVLGDALPKYLNSPETDIFHRAVSCTACMKRNRITPNHRVCWLSKAIWTSWHWRSTTSTTPSRRWGPRPPPTIFSFCSGRPIRSSAVTTATGLAAMPPGGRWKRRAVHDRWSSATLYVSADGEDPDTLVRKRGKRRLKRGWSRLSRSPRFVQQPAAAGRFEHPDGARSSVP